MQALFAYRQSREANRALALDRIDKTFSPDLNSMEFQDKEQLRADKKAARQLFNTHYDRTDFKPASGKVELTVADGIRQYHEQNTGSKEYIKKLMVIEAEKISHRYLLILLLLTKFAEMAENDQKQNQAKFVKNALIKAINFNNSLETISLKHHLSWANEFDTVRGWFKNLVKTDEKYQDYLKSETSSFEEDRELLLHIIKNIIFKKEAIAIFLEENDLGWDEDKAIVKSLAIKTLKSIEEEAGGAFEIQVLSHDWENDKVFFQKIFEETLHTETQYAALIADKAKNWDIDRIATTDRILIDMAITEMIRFPGIPVKVSINEYIEVAKRYSTPKSKVFINGILDVVAEELLKNHTIKKSGRGLIDSK